MTNNDAGGEGEEVKIRKRSAHGNVLLEDLGFGTGPPPPKKTHTQAQQDKQ